MLLLIAITAISLAWYAEHFGRYRREILGTWHYSHGGYRTTLVTRPDGTFTKTQHSRTSGKVFEGTYENYDGAVVFIVLKKEEFMHSVDGPHVLATDLLNEKFVCRWATCNSGHLLIHCLDNRAVADEMRLNWESYKPVNAR